MELAIILLFSAWSRLQKSIEHWSRTLVWTNQTHPNYSYSLYFNEYKGQWNSPKTNITNEVTMSAGCPVTKSRRECSFIVQLLPWWWTLEFSMI